MEIVLEIQELDKERLALNDQLRSYPALWEDIKKRREKLERDLERAVAEEKDFQSSRTRMEQEIKVGRDLLKRYEGQISLMRTQREVSALSTQIDQTRQRLTKFEEEHARLLERETELKENVEKAREAFKAIQQEAKEERERIRTQIRSKKERLADIEATRKQLVAKVKKPMMSVYDRLLRRWPGSAVAPVRNGSCTGCHFAVLPQKMVEIHREKELAFCDNCGRIFSQDEDFKPEESEAVSSE